MDPVMRNEVHLVDYPNGHHLSTDCWCEPTNIKWVRNKHGIDILVVEHSDDTAQHRVMVLDRREHSKRIITLRDPAERTPDAVWITRILDLPPSSLPPHDPHERSL